MIFRFALPDKLIANTFTIISRQASKPGSLGTISKKWYQVFCFFFFAAGNKTLFNISL
jgi:hypothetical protein